MMINSSLTIFAYRSYLLVLSRIYSNRYTLLTVWKTLLHCFGGFVFIRIFTLVVQYSQTTEKLGKASNQKNEFSKYKQRELPSNDQLPSTRLRLHSIPDNPVRAKGVVLDCTKGSLLYYYNYLSVSLMGMKVREGMSINLNT